MCYAKMENLACIATVTKGAGYSKGSLERDKVIWYTDIKALWGQFVIFDSGRYKFYGLDLSRRTEFVATSRNKHHKMDKRVQIDMVTHTCTYTCSYRRRLTEENDGTEQYGHQSSSREAIWKGQDLGVTGLHVSTAVTSTHAHDQRAGAALNGVVIVRDHDGQEVHAHLAPAETSPPRQDIGSVICGKMQTGKALQWWDVSLS